MQMQACSDAQVALVDALGCHVAGREGSKAYLLLQLTQQQDNRSCYEGDLQGQNSICSCMLRFRCSENGSEGAAAVVSAIVRVMSADQHALVQTHVT